MTSITLPRLPLRRVTLSRAHVHVLMDGVGRRSEPLSVSRSKTNEIYKGNDRIGLVKQRKPALSSFQRQYRFNQFSETTRYEIEFGPSLRN